MNRARDWLESSRALDSSGPGLSRPYDSPTDPILVAHVPAREAYGRGRRKRGVNRDVLLTALTAVFAGLAATLGIAGLAAEPLLLVLAVPFGVVAYVMWYNSSGRLGERVYRSVEQAGRIDSGARGPRGPRGRRRQGRAGGGTEGGAERGGFGAGPRDDWEPQGAWARRAREERRRERERARADAASGRTGRTGPGGSPGSRADPRGTTRREAYEVLGVEPGADQETIRTAYREKVKTVHPDAKTGDEEAFKRVTAAYDRLTD